MVVVSETKESQLLALLEQCVHLDADVRTYPASEKRPTFTSSLLFEIHIFTKRKRLAGRISSSS